MHIYAQYCTYIFTVSDVLFNVCLNNYVMKTSSLKTGSLPVKFKALFSIINFPYERLTCTIPDFNSSDSGRIKIGIKSRACGWNRKVCVPIRA